MFAGLQALLVHCGVAMALMFVVAVVGVGVTGPSVSAEVGTVLRHSRGGRFRRQHTN